MIIRRSAFVVCYLGLSSVFAVLHAEDKAEPMALTPAEMKWKSQGGLALPGIEQANLVGDPSKSGPYTVRLRFPAGYRLAPHTHPDYREVTILFRHLEYRLWRKVQRDSAESIAGGELLH